MKKTSTILRERLVENNQRFWSNDNISHIIEEGDKDGLIDELTEQFENVLDSLVIDRHTDPNAKDTGSD